MVSRVFREVTDRRKVKGSRFVKNRYGKTSSGTSRGYLRGVLLFTRLPALSILVAARQVLIRFKMATMCIEDEERLQERA